jgi:hypothetical protein
VTWKDEIKDVFGPEKGCYVEYPYGKVFLFSPRI